MLVATERNYLCFLLSLAFVKHEYHSIEPFLVCVYVCGVPKSWISCIFCLFIGKFWFPFASSHSPVYFTLLINFIISFAAQATIKPREMIFFSTPVVIVKLKRKTNKDNKFFGKMEKLANGIIDVDSIKCDKSHEKARCRLIPTWRRFVAQRKDTF